MRVLAILAAVFFMFAVAPVASGQQQGLGTLSAQGVRAVAGTHWQGQAIWDDGESRLWTLYFRPDGVLEYGYEGAHFDNGRWTQNDQLLTFHTNQYFALYVGTLSGSEIRGVMYNRRGQSGAFAFFRQ